MDTGDVVPSCPRRRPSIVARPCRARLHLGPLAQGRAGLPAVPVTRRHRRSAGPRRAGRYHRRTNPRPERGSTSVSHASPQTSPSHAVTIRGIVRAAVERAWERAVASGALPAMPADADRAGRRGRAPGRPGARRLRQQPRDEARPAVPDGAAGDRRGARGRADRGGGRRPGRARSPPPRSRRPASSTCASRDGALEATIAAILADPAQLGPDRRRGHGPRRQRRVRLGQPDRAAPRRQRPRRVHRRPAQPRPRGRRPARHARVLLQRLGRPDPQPRRVGRRAPARASRSPRTATTATTSRSWRRLSRTTSGRRRRRRAPTRDGIARALGGGSGPRGHRGQPRARSASASTSGRARRGSTTRAGSTGPSSGCASAATSTSRTARSGSARPTSATTRTGSSSARTASRPTSRPTSATSPRSSAAASTT